MRIGGKKYLKRNNGKPAVFLDRDGVICEDVRYLTNPSQIKFLPKVVEAIRILNEMGVKVITVTNQSVIARNMLSINELETIHKQLLDNLRNQGARIDAIYYCPHHPNGIVKNYAKNCDCRKPEPGLLLKAIDELKIDPLKSFMVGDKQRDIIAGKKVGCKTILVSSNKDECFNSYNYSQDYTVTNLLEAIPFITLVLK